MFNRYCRPNETNNDVEQLYGIDNTIKCINNLDRFLFLLQAHNLRSYALDRGRPQKDHQEHIQPLYVEASPLVLSL